MNWIIYISLHILSYVCFSVLFNKSANEAQHQQMQVLESSILIRVGIFVFSPVFLIMFLAIRFVTFLKIHLLK